jgi:hypothetical protein
MIPVSHATCYRLEPALTKDGERPVTRPVIRIDRTRVFTRITKKPDTSLLLCIRPGWDDLRLYLEGCDFPA